MFRKIKNKWKIILWTLVPLLLLISVILIRSLDKPNDPIDSKNVRVYDTIDSLSHHFNKNEIVEHNKIIISTLQEREVTRDNAIFSRENNLREIRTIYVALLGIILAIVFNQKNNKKWVIFLLLLLIGGIYSIEVHVKDLLDRGQGCCTVVHRSVEEIVNSDKIYSEYFVINFDKLLNQQYEAHNYRYSRKLWKAVHPDWEQIVLYVFPCALIYIWLLVAMVVKQDSSEIG
ncbi:MAG: hypothetical protein WAU11_02660 [Ignavibacteriaceae bacterium]